MLLGKSGRSKIIMLVQWYNFERKTMRRLLTGKREQEILNKINYNDFEEYVWCMNSYEKEFLTALILDKKPKKCLELGPSYGASSLGILNALKSDNNDAILYSIDVLETLPDAEKRKVGYVVDDYPDLKKNWRLYTGAMAHHFMDEIGDGIDFCVIDTVHMNPGEILDFLIVLPFLTEDAIVCFHDVSSHTIMDKRLFEAYTNTLLMSSINGEKILMENSSLAPSLGCAFPNMAAIKLNSSTKEHIGELFNLLTIKWKYEYAPSEVDLKLLAQWFGRFYGEDYRKYFEDIVKYQTQLKKAINGYNAIISSSPIIIENKKRENFLSKIFSIKNEYTANIKRKVVSIFGAKLKIRV